ncbi:Methionine synthase [Seminavis robusta]|uniref:Methionine synthase n=1 Tax=Seminavis robusta TaxID=568900 RepID=A0A9N8EBG2_9STRA|nr:Methionine synthase [Seminavis robusta]|eukprot:Sro767_g199430.1 Methionine synthase (365) ;mRNA; r:12769-14072
MRALWITLSALASKSGGRRIMSSSTSGARPNRVQIQDLWKKLRSNKAGIFLLDGGTGEELFQRGVPDDRKIWSATALVHPEYQPALRDVHKSFLAAGAQAITTNSYGVVPGVGFTSEEIEKHVTTAGRIARETVDDFNNNNPQCEPKLVLGSLGPLLESYRPDKLMESEEGIKIYGVMARALLPFVDVFIAETMSCVEEATQAIRAVGTLEKDDGASCRTMIVSYTLASSGCLRDSETATRAVTRTMDLCKESGVELLGVLFNCAEPEAITKALASIREDSALQQRMTDQGVLTGAYANRLTPVDPNWSLAESEAPQATRDDLSVERYSNEFVSPWVNDFGATFVGGCCGITPAYIEHIHKHLR